MRLRNHLRTYTPECFVCLIVGSVPGGVNDAELGHNPLNIDPPQLLAAKFRCNGVERVTELLLMLGRVAREVIGVVIHQLQEALETSTGMVRSLAVVAMWKEHHQS